MALNNINIFRQRPFILGPSEVFNGDVLPIADFTSVTVDVILRRIAADTNVAFRIQMSDDGVTWIDPSFTSTLSVTAGSPQVRVAISALPTRRLMRLTATNNTANATQVEWNTVRKTNA